jgi:metal-responsive CopG/Arc/MetJ family transcriptional regulator
MKRVNITISDDLLSRSDSYAKKKGLNRSVLITMALNTYLDAMDELPNVQAQLNDLKVAFDEFVKNN